MRKRLATKDTFFKLKFDQAHGIARTAKDPTFTYWRMVEYGYIVEFMNNNNKTLTRYAQLRPDTRHVMLFEYEPRIVRTTLFSPDIADYDDWRNSLRSDPWKTYYRFRTTSYLDDVFEATSSGTPVSSISLGAVYDVANLVSTLRQPITWRISFESPNSRKDRTSRTKKTEHERGKQRPRWLAR